MTTRKRGLRLRIRFEAKVVLAVVIVALVPVVAMLALGQAFLTTAISQGLNTGIERDLARGFTARRELFETVKALFRRHADVIARDAAALVPRDDVRGEPRVPAADEREQRQAFVALLERQLDGIDALARVQILAHDGRVIADASRSARLGTDRRTRTERRALPNVGSDPAQAPLVLVATFSIEWERFREFERAGQRLRVYSVMRRSQVAATLVGVLKAQVVLLPIALVASVLLAWAVARNVTRRVKLLSLATARVGQGDLSVRVRPRGLDEVDDLMQAFNAMVEDMQISRSRIEYLQRIGAWQEFARRLAHEIKNPLTPIQLAVQEVAKKYRGDDAAFAKTLDAAREVVEEEIATLRRLVDAFSNFARLPDVKPALGDLAEFVRDAGENRAFLDEAAAGIDGRAEVAVHFDERRSPIPVEIDRMLLRRALDNLVRNAIEAGAKNVWVRAEAHAEQAWLVVEDDGPGVPESARSRVFDPYFTTKSDGTGLGLAIVRKLAFDHHGDVGLEARPGGGARFVVTLPIAAPDRPTRPSFVTFDRSRRA